MKNKKDQHLKKNTVFGLFYKSISILLIYLTVPLLIEGLGLEQYGVWITMYSIFGWIYSLDLGIGNGLKNNLTIAFSKEQKRESNQYIVTAFVGVFCIAIVFLLLFSLIIFLVPISTSLNIDLKEKYLKTIFSITLISVVFNFVLSLYKQLFHSLQKSYLVELASLLINFTLFLLFYILENKNIKLSLLSVTIIYGVVNIIIALIFNFKFFADQKGLRLSFNHFRMSKAKQIFKIGVQFFLIQICLIIILTTDNLLIAYFLGTTEVALYDNVNKLFQIFLIGTTVVLMPLWTLFADAYNEKDFDWIRKTIKRLNYWFIVLSFVVLTMVFFGSDILFFWIGKDLSYPKYLILLMGVFVLIRVYGNIYIYAVNGFGKIKLQTILFVIGAIANILLSLFFLKYTSLGSSGVILASILSMFSFTILIPIQVFKILKNP